MKLAVTIVASKDDSNLTSEQTLVNLQGFFDQIRQQTGLKIVALTSTLQDLSDV